MTFSGWGAIGRLGEGLQGVIAPNLGGARCEDEEAEAAETG